MQKRARTFSQFFFFFVLSLLSLIIFRTEIGKNIQGFLEFSLSPVQHIPFQVEAASPKGSVSEIDRLKEENVRLRLALAKATVDQKEINALRDQFKESAISSRSLLPAKIVGLKGFIPGYSTPDEIILDKGKIDNVQVGQTVVLNNIIIGKVEIVSQRVSLVSLLTKEDVSLTALAADTGALGVVKGEGDGSLLLDNVVLSESLKVDDLVVSKGSVDDKERGVPPGLAIGRIKSVEKKPSALFQTAKLESLFKITQLTTVFILQ